MADYISEDNLLLIFKYLPVESLLRFRSVCKGWKEIIDSPALMQDHLSVQSQNSKFIVDYARLYNIVDPRPRPLVHTIKKPIEKKDFILFGTLHGVVCLYESYEREIVLWNPSIHKYSRLPLGFRWQIEDRYRSTYGFWIDPSTKEFKIIVLQPRFDMISFKNVLICNLYSSIRGDWSVIPIGNLGNWKLCKQCPPVMFGGVAHWGGCLDESRNGFDNHLEHV